MESVFIVGALFVPEPEFIVKDLSLILKEAFVLLGGVAVKVIFCPSIKLPLNPDGNAIVHPVVLASELVRISKSAILIPETESPVIVNLADNVCPPTKLDHDAEAIREILSTAILAVSTLAVGALSLELPPDRTELAVKRILNEPVVLAGGVASTRTVSYTHLTLPTKA